MPFTIKFIKDCDFVDSLPFAGTVEEASRFAAASLTERQADLAAIMDEADPDGAPRALVMAGG